jgi:NADPH2:quinone reductase
MRALIATDYGPPDRLQIAEVPDPHPGPGEILVRMRAAAVNPFDVKLVRGELRDAFPLQFPYHVGMDGAGTVAELGQDVSRFQLDDEVFGMWFETPGTIAEYAVIEAGSPFVEARPEALDPLAAACLPEVGLTAERIVRAAAVRAAETVLVIGASGGIGMVLLPMLRDAGARVLATARADDATYVRDLGASDLIDYTAPETVAETMRLHPDGVDVVVDLVNAGEALFESARALRPGGRLISPLTGPGSEAFARDVKVSYVLLDAEPGDLAMLARRAIEGRQPVEIARTYQFEEAATALTDLDSRHTRGKLAIALP